MRAVICGDSHIGAVFGLGRSNGSGGNTRVDDYEESLNHIIDYTINSGADIFIQTGDMFEFRDPDVRHMAIVDKALKKLSNANVSTFVIMGNHDYRRNGDAFTSSITSLGAADYPNVRMVLNPEVIRVCKSDGDSANLLLLPFRDQRMYPGKGNQERSVAFEDQIQSMIASAGSDSPLIAVGHNFFYEGSYNDFGGSELMVKPSAFSGCDAAMMGHLHQFRVVRKTAPVCIYTGSMERSNFGDANVDKYFIDYDLSRKRASFKKVPSRGLLDHFARLSDLDFSSIKQAVESEVDLCDVKDKIVRFKVAIDEELAPAVNKELISNRLYENGAFYVSKVTIEIVAKRIVRDSTVLKHKDDHSMFRAFIESQGLDKGMLESILAESKIIMESK
jgi:DNA repair protein SbcD/Mre11